ncbi:MAG: transcription termination factor Rho [Gemmatimonadota bacterium]|nr:transcription termination factor Rho [Gemmatimonadota bacterium]
MEIAELKNRTVAELQGYAEALDIPNCVGLRKQELIFRIHEGLAARDETPVAEGVLDIMPDGYGFLRSQSWSYLASPDDIYVSPAQIGSFGLRKGDTVAGPVRPPRRSERYLALRTVQRINGFAPAATGSRPRFEKLRPWYPDRRLTLEVRGGETSMRIMDLIAPVGMGQRGLIVSPPKAGKTTILRHIARAIAANHPDVELTVLLIDERPEEVTEMEDNVRGRVVASTFDEPAARHRQVAEMVLARAQRQVEHGRDAVILLDSITRLARAYNILAPHSGRILSGGVDANALSKPKRFFGSARSMEGGGSLTIIATALIETGSRMDEVIFEEFKGTGNMELVLSREVADRRIYPAIDLNRSGTRREELLLSETELNRVYLLRNFLADMPAPEAAEFLMQRIGRDATNREFLAAMAAGE